MSEVQSDSSNESTNVKGTPPTPTANLSDDERQAVQLGVKAYTDKDYATAVRYLEPLSAHSEHWKALACLGLSYYNLKRYGMAEAVFARIVEQCPEHEIVVRAVQALDKVRAAIGDPSASYTGIPNLASHADTGVHLGLNQKVPEGEYDPQATGTFGKPDLSPADREKHIKWGTRHYLNGRFEDAIKYLESGCSGDEENWNARLALAMSYHKVGQTGLGEILINAILSQCTDQKILARAKQSMDSIKFEQTTSTTAERLAYEENLVAQQAEKQKNADKRKAEAVAAHEAAQAAWIEERSQREASTRPAQKSNPMAPFLLLVLLIGLGYYFGLGFIPQLYASLFMKDAQAYSKSVSDFGVLEGVSPRPETVPGASGSKLNAVAYDKPGATRWLLIHSGTIDDWTVRKAVAEAALQSGFSVFVYDARGHGRTTGPARWQGIADDGLFAYDYLHGKLGVKGGNIASYGYSMACAPASAAAETREHAAVVLQNPFVSLTMMAREKAPMLLMVPESFCPEPDYRYLQTAKTHAPVFVIESKSDPIVTGADTEAFFAHVSGSKDLQNSTNIPASDLVLKDLAK